MKFNQIDNVEKKIIVAYQLIDALNNLHKALILHKKLTIE